MIEQIITYLNNRLDELGIFTQIYCLAEQVEGTDDKMWPRAYDSRGSFKDITAVSSWLGSSYFRKDGSVGIEVVKEGTYKACAIPLEVTIPLIFIGTVNRKTVKDDAYTDDRICALLIKTLMVENPAMKSEIKASKLLIYVNDYSTDRKEITEGEFKNVEVKINYGYSYVRLKMEVKISIDKSCLDDMCDGVLIDENDNKLIDQNNNKLKAI